MAKYAVFESTNLRAVHYAQRIFDAVAETDIENGTFGYLDGQLAGYAGDVMYKFVPGTKEGLKLGDIVVANNPAWSEDDSKIVNQRRDQYIIPAGTPFRVFVVQKEDEFAVSVEGFVSASKEIVEAKTTFVGAANNVFVTIDQSTGKLVASTSAPQSGVMIGRIMRKRTVGTKVVTPLREYGSATVLYEVKINSLG